MITVNSLSGGKTSAYMAVHFPADVEIFACVCIDDPICAPKDKTVLNYCLDKLDGNFIASAEHEKTLRVMMQLEQKIGKEIVWVRGKSFDQIIDEAGCLPTWARRFCTTDMKIIPIFEYVYFRYGVVNMNIGFRTDEAERAYIFKPGEKPIKKEEIRIDYRYSRSLHGKKRHKILKNVLYAMKQYPLIDARIVHLDVISYWAQNPDFDFPIDSNCRGCHHKLPELIKQNYNETPDILNWFARQEEKGKYNTWHDDLIPYKEKFKMNFTERIDFDYTTCNSGYCTD